MTPPLIPGKRYGLHPKWGAWPAGNSTLRLGDEGHGLHPYGGWEAWLAIGTTPWQVKSMACALSGVLGAWPALWLCSQMGERCGLALSQEARDVACPMAPLLDCVCVGGYGQCL